MSADSTLDVRALVTVFAKDHKDIAELAFINADAAGVEIKDISGGLVNYVYQVTSRDTKQSVVLKHAKTTSKMRSLENTLPGDEITLTRLQLEYNGLVLMEDIEPGSVPTPYCYDATHSIIAMADMSSWEHLADQLEAGVVDMEVPVYLGHLLAKVHHETSRPAVSADRWQQLRHDFRNNALRTACSNFCYEWPYNETGRDNRIPPGGLEAYRQYVAVVNELGLREKLSELFSTEVCFIHADLHWKSLFVKAGKAVLFDWEMAFMSHPGQNIGYVVHSYIVFHIITQSQARDAAAKAALQAQFAQAITHFLETYMQDISDTDLPINLNEIALFTGSQAFTSSVYCGTAMFTNITPADLLALMHIGFRLMEQHEALTSVDKIISSIFDK